MFLIFSQSNGQSLDSLNIDYGIAGLKLGTTFEELNKTYRLLNRGTSREDSSINYSIRFVERYHYPPYEEKDTIQENRPLAKFNGIGMNLEIKLYFSRDTLYKIEAGFSHQSNESTLMLSYLYSRYGKRSITPNSGGLRIWETSKVKLTYYEHDQSAGRMSITAKKIRVPKKSKSEETSSKFIRTIYISNKPQKVPKGRVWEVESIIDKSTGMETNYGLLYIFRTDIPNTYPQIIMNGDTSMPVVFDSFKESDMDGVDIAINTGLNPITNFPLHFEPGFKLMTKTANCKIKIREFIRIRDTH